MAGYWQMLAQQPENRVGENFAQAFLAAQSAKRAENHAKFQEQQQLQQQAQQQEIIKAQEAERTAAEAANLERQKQIFQLRRGVANGDPEAIAALAQIDPNDSFLQKVQQSQIAERDARLKAEQQNYDRANATMDPLAKEVINATGLRFGTPEFIKAYAVAKKEDDRQKMARASAAGGRTLAPTNVEGLADAQTAVGSVDALLRTFSQSVSSGDSVDRTISRAKGMVPNTAVAQYQNDADVTAQVVGTFLEGGKLAEADLPRYKKMMPQPGDSPETAQRKRDTIVSLIESRAAGRAQSLRSAGYNLPGRGDRPRTPPTTDTGGDINLNELSDEELARIAGGQ